MKLPRSVRPPTALRGTRLFTRESRRRTIRSASASTSERLRKPKIGAQTRVRLKGFGMTLDRPCGCLTLQHMDLSSRETFDPGFRGMGRLYFPAIAAVDHFISNHLFFKVLFCSANSDLPENGLKKPIHPLGFSHRNNEYGPESSFFSSEPYVDYKETVLVLKRQCVFFSASYQCHCYSQEQL